MSKLFLRFGQKVDSLDLTRARGVLWGVEAKRLVLMEQTHSNKVKEVKKEDLGCGFTKPALPVVDAVCSDMPNILLVVKSADCVPILFYDPIHNAVAAAHSGRKGTQNAICVRVLEKMHALYGSMPQEMQVSIGPGVSGEHYQVSQAIYDRFVEQTGLTQPVRGQLDLRKVIVADLLRSGVSAEHLRCSSECTYSNDKYFSYRRDKSCGRQLSAIGVLDGTNF